MTDNTALPRQYFNNLVQIGVVVKDLERSIKGLSELFGIGPFHIIEWPPAGRDDLKKIYHGRPANFTARMAFADLGPVELEIIQPISGESIWADFLREHGEGLHHIRFNVDQVEPVIEYLSCHGVGVSQMGSGLRPGTSWVYFDTQERIGFIIEILNALPGTDGRTPRPDSVKW